MSFDLDPQSIKAGFDLIKGALDNLKSARDLFRGDPSKQAELARDIEAAEKQIKLGEAQLAQALGYRLCRAHFPPVPMLRNRVEPTYVEEVHKCPECGAEEPSPEHFEAKRRKDAAVRQMTAIRSNPY